MVTCDVCKKNKAVYLRTYSGHRLCPRCLERILARPVKRVIGESGLLRPNSRIALVVRPSSPAFSLAGLRLVAKVESKFNVKIIVIIPSQLEGMEQVNETLEVASRRTVVEKVKREFPAVKGDELSMIACVRLERAWGLTLARELGAEALLYPLDRTTSNLLALEALLEGDPEGLSEALPALPWTEPPTIHYLHRVEAEALTAYAFIDEAWVDPLCTPALPSKIPFLSLMGSRPELEFSSTKTLERLAINLSEKWNKCPYCGGFARSKGACSYCKSLGVPRLLENTAK